MFPAWQIQLTAMSSAARDALKIVLANSQTAFAETIIIVNITEPSMPDPVSHEHTIRIEECDSSSRAAAVPATIPRVMTIYEFSALPTLVVPPRPAAPTALGR
jgi:hypothetical protein